jgi:hypothetical protein
LTKTLKDGQKIDDQEQHKLGHFQECDKFITFIFYLKSSLMVVDGRADLVCGFRRKVQQS